MPGLKALAHHGELLLDAPAATPLLAEHFDMSVFAGSHKHDRLPIPYGKGETMYGVSGGSFTGVLGNVFNETRFSVANTDFVGSNN